MPEERRVQARARLEQRYAARGRPGGSPWLVFGIIGVAASLVAVGVLVVAASLRDESSAAGSPAPAPTPTVARATPAVIVVGRQDPPADGAPTPSTGGAGTSGGGPTPAVLQPPSSGGGPLFSPAPPGLSSAPPPAGLEPGPTAPPASGQSVEPPPGADAGAAGGPVPSPATAGSPPALPPALEREVAAARARLTTVEDQVGQLLLLAWIGSAAEGARPALAELRAGGIVFVQNASTSSQAKALTSELKRIARDSNLSEPLLAIDHEGGIVQRIRDVPNEGTNWAFAATSPSDTLACQRGARHAQVLREMGFSMNLAPVLDVNNNPANPVIGTRSYAADPALVARLGAAYIRGLQGGGVAAVGKHFPGHGNTSVDSHVGLPSLPQTAEDLARIELVPFRAAIEAGVAGIMSAHIVFPAVDPSGAPATLSHAVMTGLLREQLEFRGLAVSDDMGAMRAITDHYRPGEAAVLAVKAGVDLLILSAELPRQREAHEALVAAVRAGEISRERLDEALRNVLTVKARFGLLGVPAQTGGGCS